MNAMGCDVIDGAWTVAVVSGRGKLVAHAAGLTSYGLLKAAVDSGVKVIVFHERDDPAGSQAEFENALRVMGFRVWTGMLMAVDPSRHHDVPVVDLIPMKGVARIDAGRIGVPKTDADADRRDKCRWELKMAMAAVAIAAAGSSPA